MRALLLALALAGAPEGAGEAADAFLAAWRVKDEAVMQRLAAAEEPDPFLVADALSARHGAGALREPPEPGDFLAAAAALAARVEGRKIDAGLAALVRTWSGLGAEELRREAALREGKSAEPGSSVTAIRRARLGAEELRKAGRADEAARAFRAAAGDAARIGWHRETLTCLRGIGRIHEGRARHDEAIAIWEEELALLRQLERRDEAAEARVRIANEHANLRRFARARELIEEALPELEAAGKRAAAAAARASLGGVLKEMGRTQEARSTLERALEENEALPNRGKSGWVRMNLAVLDRDEGRNEEAIERLRLAREELTAGGDRLLAERCLAMTADIQFRLGQTEAAVRSYERARTALEAIGDRNGVAMALISLGRVERSRGRYAEALDRFEQARRLQDRLRNPAAAEHTTVAIAETNTMLGLYREARDLLERVLEAQDGRGDRRSAGATIEVLVNIALCQGDEDRAIALLERSLEEARRAGLRDREALHLYNLGRAAWQAGHPEQAEKSFERAAREYDELGDQAKAAMARTGLGRFLVSQDRPDEALELLENARRVLEKLGNPVGRVYCLLGLAQARLALGAPGEALRLARDAIGDIRAAERGLGEDETPTGLTVARSLSNLGLEAALLLSRGEPAERERGPAEALWSIEAGRGVLLAQGLLNRAALLDTQLPEELRSAHAAARARVDASLRRLAGRPPAGARAELDAAYGELEAASRRIQREARRVSQLLFPEPVALAALQAALPEGSALVLYQLTKERALAFVAGRASAGLIDLGPARDAIGRVESWLRVVSAQGADEGADVEQDQARALYDVLLRPLEPLVGGAQRLLISPDGVLSFLPFEALLREEGGKRERALERWEMAYVPSGTVFTTLLSEARGSGRGEGLLAFGDPAYPADPAAETTARQGARMRGFGPLARLPATAEEVRALASLFPEKRARVVVGEAASVTGVVQALGETDGRLAAIHFACHGFVDPERPRLTGLVLAGGGVLGLDDLYGLRIPADLAVLSACETARGKLVTGDGVVGLVRGFFHAGVPRVVVSDWKVSDEGTQPLMVAFYRKMLEERRTPCAALRAAKLERLRAGGASAHPAKWAAFVLWGLPE
jgi:CHAT domain-containing protein/predicted negative regulator of RcsB-dependent stress response